MIAGPLGPFGLPDADPRTRASTEILTRQIFEQGAYDHPELPTEGIRTILDIGAGWGAFAVWAMHRWPGANITCYEPHDRAAELLLENVTRYGVPGLVAISRCAVTTEFAPRLNGCEDWGSYHTHGTGDGGWPVSAIDPKYLPPCDLVKVDNEGCEIEFLENYPNTPRVMLIEWHGSANRARVTEIAESRGYRCLRNDPEEPGYGVGVWVKT
jgi:hypothetical protein